MIIEVHNFNDLKDNGVLFEFKVRKNAKNIVSKIENEIIKKYNCSIRAILPQGSIDFLSGQKNIHYLMWGNNLPCNIFKYFVKEV